MASVPGSAEPLVRQAFPRDTATQTYVLDEVLTPLSVTAGTAAASKVVRLDANSKIDTLDITTLKVGGTAVTSTAAELNILDGVTATAAEINSAADVSGKLVDIPDANTALNVADSGKPHIVANVSADRTFTFPAEAAGLHYIFYADVVAADDFDWIFTTGSDTNYFTGGVVHLDTDADAGGDEIVMVAPDGNSNSKLQVNLPQPGTKVEFICDGTLWTVSGIVVSATAPAFADQ